MKRVLAAALLLMLLFAACAEESKQAFTFRNGVHWGMSHEEVIAAEGNPKCEIDEDEDALTVGIEDVEYGEQKCRLEYDFLNDELFMISVEFNTEDGDVSFDSLKRKLTSLYGEPGDFSDDVKSELSDEEIEELDGIASWTLADATEVWLMDDSEEHAIEIMFVDLDNEEV